MKKIFLALALLGALSPGGPLRADPMTTVENFDDDPTGKFPTPFRTYPFQRGKAQQVYRVAEEGGKKFLRAADSQGLSTLVFRRFPWDPEKKPLFSWQWRARVLPQGASEANAATNDSACGVYVVFGGYTGKALKYVWSTTLPVGTVLNKDGEGKMYFIVLQSGAANLDTWQTQQVDVLKDYRRTFGGEPGRDPSGFGLLTDGNATHTPAACDYADFQIGSSG